MRALTGSFFLFRKTDTSLVQPAMSYALLVIRATMSLSRCVILNLERSGLKVTCVKSCWLAVMVALLEVLMLFIHVWSERERKRGGKEGVG